MPHMPQHTTAQGQHKNIPHRNVQYCSGHGSGRMAHSARCAHATRSSDVDVRLALAVADAQVRQRDREAKGAQHRAGGDTP